MSNGAEFGWEYNNAGSQGNNYMGMNHSAPGGGGRQWLHSNQANTALMQSSCSPGSGQSAYASPADPFVSYNQTMMNQYTNFKPTHGFSQIDASMVNGISRDPLQGMSMDQPMGISMDEGVSLSMGQGMSPSMGHGMNQSMGQGMSPSMGHGMSQSMGQGMSMNMGHGMRNALELAGGQRLAGGRTAPSNGLQSVPNNSQGPKTSWF